MQSCSWLPFIKAALERNPVCPEMTESMSVRKIYNWLREMDNISIYHGSCLAQPDEVANYQTGDGLEKAFVLANVLRSKKPQQDIRIETNGKEVTLKERDEYRFVSDKQLQGRINIFADGTIDIER